jgi:hypothetical protein
MGQVSGVIHDRGMGQMAQGRYDFLDGQEWQGCIRLVGSGLGKPNVDEEQPRTHKATRR